MIRDPVTLTHDRSRHHQQPQNGRGYVHIVTMGTRISCLLRKLAKLTTSQRPPATQPVG